MPEIRDNHQSQCQRPQQHVNINEVKFPHTYQMTSHFPLGQTSSVKERKHEADWLHQPHLHCIFAQR